MPRTFRTILFNVGGVGVVFVSGDQENVWIFLSLNFLAGSLSL